MKRVILCPNPYRDSELTVAKRASIPNATELPCGHA